MGIHELLHPYINEYRWGEMEPAVSLKVKGVFGCQAFPISVEKAFSQQ